MVGVVHNLVQDKRNQLIEFIASDEKYISGLQESLNVATLRMASMKLTLKELDEFLGIKSDN